MTLKEAKAALNTIEMAGPFTFDFQIKMMMGRAELRLDVKWWVVLDAHKGGEELGFFQVYDLDAIQDEDHLLHLLRVMLEKLVRDFAYAAVRVHGCEPFTNQNSDIKFPLHFGKSPTAKVIHHTTSAGKPMWTADWVAKVGPE